MRRGEHLPPLYLARSRLFLLDLTHGVCFVGTRNVIKGDGARRSWATGAYKRRSFLENKTIVLFLLCLTGRGPNSRFVSPKTTNTGPPFPRQTRGRNPRRTYIRTHACMSGNNMSGSRLQGGPVRQPVHEVAGQSVPEEPVLVGLVDHSVQLRQGHLAGATQSDKTSSSSINHDDADVGSDGRRCKNITAVVVEISCGSNLPRHLAPEDDSLCSHCCSTQVFRSCTTGTPPLTTISLRHIKGSLL